MTLAEAKRYLSQMDCSSRPVAMIDYARMKGGILVTITEDTMPASEIPGLSTDVTTRRLSVFVKGDRHVGTILDRPGEKR